MSWSAFATQEHMLEMAAAPDSAQVVAAIGSDTERHRGGSVADHHLDDQPVQAHAEGAFDLCDLLPSEWRVPAADIGTVTPRQLVARQLPSPYLRGPLRPPPAHFLVG
ncbi:MAG: hypothetical protein ABW190_02600 [Rhizobacter sp.]